MCIYLGFPTKGHTNKANVYQPGKTVPLIKRVCYSQNGKSKHTEVGNAFGFVLMKMAMCLFSVGQSPASQISPTTLWVGAGEMKKFFSHHFLVVRLADSENEAGPWCKQTRGLKHFHEELKGGGDKKISWRSYKVVKVKRFELLVLSKSFNVWEKK